MFGYGSADTREIARSACELIQVDYEVLPPITNPIEAIRARQRCLGIDGNILSTSHYKRGALMICGRIALT